MLEISLTRDWIVHQHRFHLKHLQKQMVADSALFQYLKAHWMDIILYFDKKVPLFKWGS